MNKQSQMNFISAIGIEPISYLGGGFFGDVYRGKRGGERVIIKLPQIMNSTSQGDALREAYVRNKEHLKREHEAYVRTTGIKNIPQHSEMIILNQRQLDNLSVKLPKPIEGKELYVLVRDFVTGTTVEQGAYIQEDYRKTLFQTVRECHQAGMCGLDIKRENTIISPRGKPTLIDFGRVMFREEIMRDQWEDYVREDFMSLRELFN